MNGDSTDTQSLNHDDKAFEVARVIFWVDTPLTVVDRDGRRKLVLPGTPASQAGGTDPGYLEVILRSALDGVIADTVGEGFGVVRVHTENAGSVEFIAVVVATYVAIRQGVEVVETLQTAAQVARRLVHAVLVASNVVVNAIHSRVELTSAMELVEPLSRTNVGYSTRSDGGPISPRWPTANAMALIAILNLLLALAILAFVVVR
jgi:hypothetical protein